jgi:hypothetical protein
MRKKTIANKQLESIEEVSFMHATTSVPRQYSVQYSVDTRKMYEIGSSDSWYVIDRSPQFVDVSYVPSMPYIPVRDTNDA